MAEPLDWKRLGDALPMLASLPSDLRGCVSLRLSTRGELIFRRGDRPRFMFAVISGEARLVRTSASGAEIILQRTRHGLFAEGSLDQPRYHCDAITVLPTELAAIPRQAFRAALADETFRAAWLAELLRELRRLRAQTERLSLNAARERIVHYIEAEGQDGRIVLQQTKKDWAAELGLTHEALYRALGQMRNDGDIVVEDAAIRLISRQS